MFQKAWVKSLLATALSMLILDLLWLGVLAKPIYDEYLIDVKKELVFIPAALAFYVMYILFVFVFAVRMSTSKKQTLIRGAAMGLFAYTTYELTNWAVIAKWPAMIVPIDIAWGVFLTTTVAFIGRLVFDIFKDENKVKEHDA